MNKKPVNKKGFEINQTLFYFGCKSVGVAGFEPATSSSQTRRDNRATLHPEKLGCKSKQINKTTK